MLNHAVSIIRNRVHPLQKLGAYREVLDLFHEQLAVRSGRMFYYLLLITSRESRHEHSGSSMPAIYQKYGQFLKDFQKSFPDSSDIALNYFVDNCPKIALGPYCEFMSEQFYKGSYSSSYGGPKWGNVSDVMRDFVLGKISAEMMMDTGFTLCHNGGPIFNKGMLYHTYSSEIYKILDVQRSGQIPQLIASKGVALAKDPVVQKLYEFCRGIIGAEFEGEVDWHLVEKLGSKNKYTTEKAAQSHKMLKVPVGKPVPVYEDPDEEVDYGTKIEDPNAVWITPFMQITKVKRP
jgi:hypothetical protein